MPPLPKIAVLRPFSASALSRLATVGEILGPEGPAPATGDAAMAYLALADGALISPLDQITGEMLRAAPRLRAISSAGAGLDRLDLATCEDLGIAVANAPDATVEPTADLAMALILAAARRLPAADAFVRAGGWNRGAAPFWGLDVHHRTLGVIGFGRIGRAIARRARAFAMPVLYHDPAPLPAEEAARLEADWRPLDDLLRQSDVVVVQAPLTEKTRHMIAARELALMKPSAILVNTGRGGLVDEAALIAALRGGALAGAALDVFENEPAINPALLDCPHLVLTPHIGTATRAAREEMALLAVANLERMLSAL